MWVWGWVGGVLILRVKTGKNREEIRVMRKWFGEEISSLAKIYTVGWCWRGWGVGLQPSIEVIFSVGFNADNIILKS